MPKSTIDAAIEPADFMLNKVRLAKVVENTTWAVNFLKAVKVLLAYQTTNFPMGLNWNFNGTMNFDEFQATVKGGSATPPPPKGMAPPPPPPPAPAALAPHTGPALDKAALFAELNVGEDITKSFIPIIYTYW
jgi:hypothetical protein